MNLFSRGDIVASTVNSHRLERGGIVGGAEAERLVEYAGRTKNWKRQVHISPSGSGERFEKTTPSMGTWEYFSHDHARSRA
jgi:hypothetical protein